MTKHILIIINPESGKKKYDTYHNAIIKQFPLCKFTVFRSLHINHIFHYAFHNKEIIEKQDIVFIIGGDGTFHLILNAFYQNNISKPFMIFPAGSGNGIYKSIIYTYGKKNMGVNSYISLCKDGSSKLMDVIDITNDSNDKILKSILGVSWGIISDIDINTEWMRRIGSFRYELGAVYYLLRKYTYTGELQYKTHDGNFIIHRGEFVHFWANNTSHGSEITHSSPGAKFDDGYIHISFMTMPISRWELFQLLWKIDSGEFVKLPKVHYIKTTEFTLKTYGGHIMIDGEKSNYKTIHGKVSENKIEIIQ